MKTNLLHSLFFTPAPGGAWGLPAIIWGEPGVAKTATIRALARQYGLPCVVLSPGERGEGAFGVTPVPEQIPGDGMCLAYPAPEWVRELRDATGQEQGILFVDELNTAPPALQPALLGLIQERRVGGHQLGPKVRILGAANPVGHAASGWDLPAPVANRCGHIQWPAPTADEWSAWLIGSGSEIPEARDPSAEEEMVLAAWPEAWAKSAGQIAAFLRRRPELLHRLPKDGDPAQSGAWPSPRTWEYAARALAGARVHQLAEDEQMELVAAFIGEAACAELATWLNDIDLPDPAELLDGKITYTPDPRRLDRTDAVLSACTALVLPEKAEHRKARAKVLFGLFALVAEEAKDIIYPHMRAMVQAGLHRDIPDARKLLAGLHGIISTVEGGGK